MDNGLTQASERRYVPYIIIIITIIIIILIIMGSMDDGLTQASERIRYVPGTCYELLKWKYAHMNSVSPVKL